MFSIIVPAFNEQNYIEKCLKAVFNQKKSPDFEVLVVNNASTDSTEKLVKEKFPQAKLVSEPRKGLTKAYNKGAKESQGEILVFVDADVILPSDHLERISKIFQKNQNLIAVSGPYVYDEFLSRLITNLNLYLFALPVEVLINRFLNLGAGVISGNLAVKKKYFEMVNGFNEEIFYGLDTDLAKRIRKLGKVRFDFSLKVKTSARRLIKEGRTKMVFRYILNVIWPYFLKEPFTKNYVDIR